MTGEFITYYLVGVCLLAAKLLVTLNIAGKLGGAVRCINPARMILASWVLVNLTILAVVMALSLAKALTPTAGWAVTILIVMAVTYVQRKQSSAWMWRWLRFLAGRACTWFAIVLLGGLLVHAGFYYDATWDALTYGYPRILLWLQNGSVLVKGSTEALNIFVNEWNAEILSLWYGLLSGSDSSFLLFPIECWVMILVAGARFVRLLGRSWSDALFVAFIVATLPVVFGLSLVIKGDLLAALALLIACSEFLEPDLMKPLNMVTMVGAAFLAAGAKFVAFPTACALVLSAGILGRREIVRQPLFLLLTLPLIMAVSLGSYCANAVRYGSPLVRIPGENANFALKHLREHISGTWHRTAGLFHGAPAPEDNGRVYLLSLGLGFGLALPLALLVVRQRSRGPARASLLGRWWAEPRWWVLLGSSAMTCGLLATGREFYGWSFRYFLPALLLWTAAACAWVFNDAGVRRPSARNIWLVVLLAAAHVRFVMSSSEARPYSIREAVSMTASERKCGVWLRQFRLSTEGNILLKRLDHGRNRVLVYNQLDTFILQLFGGERQNDVTLVGSEEELRKNLAQRPNLVALTKRADVPAERFKVSEDILLGAGYQAIYRSEIQTIFQDSSASGDSGRNAWN